MSIDMNTAFSAWDRVTLARCIYCEPGRKWVDLHARLTAKEMMQSYTETGLRASVGNHANDLELVKFMIERLCGYCYPVDHFAQALSDLGFGKAVEFIMEQCPTINLPQSPLAMPSPAKFNPYPIVQDPSPGQKMEVDPKYCTLEQFELFKNNMENYCLSMSRAHEDLTTDCKQRFAALYKFVQEQFDLVAIKANEDTKKEMAKMLTHVNVQSEQIFKKLNDLNASISTTDQNTQTTNTVAPAQNKIVYMREIPMTYMTETIAKEIACSSDWRNLGLYFSEQDRSLPDINSYGLESEFGHLPPLRMVERLLTKLSKAGAKVCHLTHALKKIGLVYLAEQITKKMIL